jgi:hypothetical protein
MRLWSLPPGRQLRLAHPEMTPLERLQEARARCVVEVQHALVAITCAEQLERFGAVQPIPDARRGRPKKVNLRRRR